MNSLEFLSLAAVTLACVCSGNVSAEILTIYSTTPKGVSQGTGFFVSKDGMFVTAYHVVRNATRIDAYLQRNDRSYAFTNIAVAALDAGHDLAVMRVNGAQSVRPLRLADVVSISGKDNLEVRGNPRGMVEQVFRASTTRDELVKSTGVFDKDGGKIFQAEIDVFLLESVAYAGMSGAPVIRDGQVVGVLSGSLDEQKGITWAIPASRVLELLRGPLGNTPVSNQKPWPNFGLMRSNWRSLTRGYVRDDDAFEIIHKHRKMISRLVGEYEQIGKSWEVAVRTEYRMKAIIAVATLELGQDSPSESQQLKQANKMAQAVSDGIKADTLSSVLSAIASVYTTREALNLAASRMESLLTQADLPELDRNKVALMVSRIRLRYAEAFDPAVAVRPKALDEALKVAERHPSEINRVEFSSMADVRRFHSACELASSMTKELQKTPGFSTVFEQTEAYKEIEAHKALGMLAERYLEYLVYLNQSPATKQTK